MRRRLLSSLIALLTVTGMVILPATGVSAQPEPDFTYVEMADGVEISVSINYPEGFDKDNPRANPNTGDDSGWPTLFQMDGYAAGGSTLLTSRFGERYVTIYASIRGTGCSGGHFDLFDRVHAEDGRTIIDTFIPTQPWFNDKVGVVGHSYPGLTGWMVSSTRPQELDVIALSGLIDDLYRGIVYPGGVPNYGFPAIWTGAYRPAVEVAGNAGRLADETSSGDERCAANIAERSADPYNKPARLLDDPFLQGLTSQEDAGWWHYRSTISYIDQINKPIHLTSQWQDEQTGPRGGQNLFERLNEGLPKRLVVTNGVHRHTAVANADRLRWLDCWTYGDGDAGSDWCGGDILDEDSRVRVHFETPSSGEPNDPYIASDWPLPETDWTRYYLHSDGTLSTSADADGGMSTYVSATAGRHATEDVAIGPADGNNGVGDLTFSSGPDQLSWDVTFDEDTALAGPMHLTLTASSTAPDTDFFVDVLDVDPDGNISYLQRGMQRASHRQVDDYRSDFVTSGPEAGSYYRAHHPHTNTTTNLIVPGEATQFEVEVFPLGHLFREGHTLRIQLHAPPAKDPLSIYAWVSGQPTAVNTVFHEAVGDLEASSILLPMLSADDVARIDRSAETPECGSLAGIPCFTPAA